MASRLQLAFRRAFELQLDPDASFILLVEMRLSRNAGAGDDRLRVQGLLEFALIIAAGKRYKCRHHNRSSHKYPIHASSLVIRFSDDTTGLISVERAS